MPWRFDLLPGLIYLDEGTPGPPGPPATCASAPQLFCLGGRAGTANNGLIRLDGDGVFTGSGSDAHGLVLRSSPGAVSTSYFGVQVDTPTELDGDPVHGNFGFLVQDSPLTLAQSGYFTGLVLGVNQADWTLKAGIAGIGGIVFGNSQFKLRPAAGESQTVAGVEVFEDDSIIVCDNGGSLDLLNGMSGIGMYQQLQATTAGSVLHSGPIYGIDFNIATSASGGGVINVDRAVGLHYAPNLNSATVGDAIGLDYNPTLGTVSGVRATVRSVDPLAALLHAGQVFLGDAANVGTIFGSTGATPSGLALNASPLATLGPLALIELNANVTTWQGANAAIIFGLTNGPITLNDDVSGPATVFGYGFLSTFVTTDDSQGGPVFTLFGLNASLSNPTGVAKNIVAQMRTFASEMTIVADTAACTMNTGDPNAFATFLSRSTYDVQGGGTLVSTNVFTDFDSRNGVGAGVTLAGHVGYRYRGLGIGAFATSGAVTGDIVAFRADPGVITPGGRLLSLQSTGAVMQLSHLGPAVFGADAAPTGAYILEAIGDVHITGKLTVDGLIDPPQVVIDNGASQPPLVITNAVNVPNLDADLLDGQHADAFGSAADLTALTTTVAGKVPTSRTVGTTGPLAGGGDLSANRTLSIAKATASVDGYLAAADFAAFTAKAALTDTKTLAAQGAAAGPVNFANTATGGLYAIFYTLRCSTADALAVGIVTVTFAWNDGTGARTVVSGNVAITALTAIASGVVGLIRLGSGNITYQTAITASLGTGKYDLDATLVRVG